MSHRHLMARFVTAAPKVEWKHGWTLPHRAAEIEHFNDAHGAGDPIDPSTLSTGIVHHGEQRYALEVEPSSDRDAWYWGIHKQVGPDANNPDHWKDLGNRPEGCFCGWGKKDNGGSDLHLDDRFFGAEYPDEDDDSDDLESGRANAMYAAEEAFNNHIAGQGHGLGNVDLDDALHQSDKPATRGDFDDYDYGDIFGDGDK